jgi:hypothetical protein
VGGGREAGGGGSRAQFPRRGAYVKSARPPTGPPASPLGHTPFMLAMLRRSRWDRDASGGHRLVRVRTRSDHGPCRSFDFP